ncbi:MAG TPA: AAA family ATPase [Noviherbaspirillum sp.]|nr:AAA family ATPase [Noviherbaspirillum sp.]
MMHEQERAASALLHLDPSCPREEWVKAGMAAKAAGLSFDDFHNWSASAGNYAGERDCLTVWKSFNESGPVTANSLYAMAFAQGWQDPAKRLKASNGGRSSVAPTAPRKAPVTPIKQAESAKTTEVWGRCEPAPADHPYIARKGGLSAGLRIYPHEAPPLVIRGQNVAGFLVVPCHELEGSLQTLQFIPGKGDKLNLPGASFGNGCFVVGEIVDRVYIAEGIGQAWACHAATGAAAAVCFGAGRMEKVTAAIRANHPAARLVLVPDRGKEPQAAEIARAINGEWCELPAEMPQNADVNDYALKFGADALASLLACTKEPPKPEPRFKLLGSAELHALPPLQWRIRGVLPAAGVAALYGPSASGKSFLGFDMAAAVAGGCRWFDCRVEAAPVVYAALEGEAGFRLRVAAWEAHQGRKLPDSLRMVLQPFKLTEAQDVQDLAAVVRAGAVVFVDTLNRAAPTADENSSRDMGEILEAAKQLQAMTGGLVVLVHHTGKDSAKGLRGHSSLFAAMDAAIEVSRDGDRREWRVAKSKDGQDGDAHPFRLQIEPLGVDEHGDPITSCVVVPDTATDEVKRVRLPTGGNQKLVAEALRPLFKAGITGKPGAPPTRPCIELESAVIAGAASLTCPTDKRTSRARDAITGLISRGYLGCNEGWLWVN